MASHLLAADPSVAGPSFKFGNGGVANNQPSFFPGLGETSTGPASTWFVNEWSLSHTIDPATVVLGSAAAPADPLYGAPSFDFSNVDHTHDLSAYQKNDGSWVYGLTAANDSIGSLSGGANLFLATTLSQPVKLDHTINYQLDARVTKAVSGDSAAFAFSGFTLNFNAANSATYDPTLPTAVLFLQIDITDSRGKASIQNYNTASISADGKAMTLIASGIAPGDPLLDFSVQSATHTLSYSSLNTYVTDYLQQTYMVVQAGKQTAYGTLNRALLDLSHWSLGGIYVGTEDNGTGPVTAASSQIGLQLSHILLSESDGAPLQGGSDMIVAGSQLPAARPAVIVPATDPDFSAAYYLAHNPDVAAYGIDPLQHYEASGRFEGRNPDAFFNVDFYLNQNPDVAASGADPLRHYQTIGWREGRDPSALFSTRDYVQANPDVAASGGNPLTHYLYYGADEGRPSFLATPHGAAASDPLIDDAYYYTHNPDVAATGMDAAVHFAAAGWHDGRNPDAFFDTAYYLKNNPDVKASGINPLVHYETDGWREGRDPSAAFSTGRYLAAYADVRQAGLDPLLHYVQFGAGEGRHAFPA